jgi:hypothetical protein
MQLRGLWKEKTRTDYPYQWSTKYRTPLLGLIPPEKWNDFKRAFGAVNRQSPEDSEVNFALEFFAKNPIWDDLTNQKTIDLAFVKSVLGSYKTILIDLDEVRDYLIKRAANVQPYDWSGHMEINRLVKELAQSKYGKEPFERVMKRIDKMNGEELKKYLIRLIQNNMVVGIEILESGEEG